MNFIKIIKHHGKFEVNTGMVDPGFWKDKRVFLTGHTGFKGTWLSLWLLEMGVTLAGYSLPPNTSPSLFQETKLEDDMVSEIGDIRDIENLTKSMSEFDPEILIHMAAQPLVRLSYLDPIETYSTNVIGTVNVLNQQETVKV